MDNYLDCVSALHIIQRQVYEVRLGSCHSEGDVFTAIVMAARFWT